MCIRDSEYSVLTWRRRERRLPRLSARPGVGGPRRVREHYRCLLYTSDAADERSSVDLGGRRIIKKKKR